MKKRVVFTAVLAACFGISAAACTVPDTGVVGRANLLKGAATATRLGYEEGRNEEFRDFLGKVDNFAAKFAASAYEQYVADGKSENFAVSPVSVFLALGMLAETTAGQTRDQICAAFDTDYTTLSAQYQYLYRTLNRISEDYYGKPYSILDADNSIWMSDKIEYKETCLENLANDYFCSTYNADFAGDNEAANAALQNHVKEATRGLIDNDFELDTETVFALVNALYLKDVWNDSGNYLPFTDQTYDFKGVDGTKSLKLLRGYYNNGRAYEDEKFTTFFTSTCSGYKIKFILPNDGYTLDDVFTAENIAKVNAIKDYKAIDNENMVIYKTRCLFPEYTASYNEDVKGILKNKFGISDVFDPNVANYSSISDDELYCRRIQHVTKLEVNKKGIEGAAVTLADNDGSAAPIYKDVYRDFILDRAFGFVLTTGDDIALFSGVVNKV